MKNKQNYLVQASFSLLLFVMLGYVIKFFPESLSDFDSSIQTAIRGDLPTSLTPFYKMITQLGNEIFIFIYTFIIALFFYFRKKWIAEAYFLAGNLFLMGILSTVFKYLYNRTRPSLVYLISKPAGPSFPSWHAASTMIVAVTLVIIVQQRMTSQFAKKLLQAVFILLAVLTAISRIYLGVHYPTDILGSWLLTYAIVAAIYPLYDQKRFEWRFHSKQK